MSNESSRSNTHSGTNMTPKISKENMAYGLSLTALCFSVSVWSNADCCVQILLMLATFVFGGVVYQKCNDKKGNKDA